MEGSDKRYFFAAAFNGKPTGGNVREGVEKVIKDVLKKNRKNFKLGLDF